MITKIPDFTGSNCTLGRCVTQNQKMTLLNTKLNQIIINELVIMIDRPYLPPPAYRFDVIFVCIIKMIQFT